MGGHTRTVDEVILHCMLVLSAILAMASLYFTSSYSTMLWIYFVGVVGGLLVAVPDYAFFNRSPLTWHHPVKLVHEAPTTSLSSYPCSTMPVGGSR